ncbi:glycosyltransferase [Acetobacter farinalis]|nr:glycosyltransferase [Acetobacter farinalis]
MIIENVIFHKFLIKILSIIKSSIKIDKSHFHDSAPPSDFLQHWEYLQKTQPSNGLITMGIGITRLLLNIPSASEPFELIRSRSTSRLSRILLTATRLHFSHYRQAYEEFQALLTQYTDLDLPAFQVLGQAVCHATNRAGWCTLSPAGKLHIMLRKPITLERLCLVSDGSSAPLSAFRTLREQNRLSVILPENWKQIEHLTLTLPGERLLGDTFHIPHFLKTEGFVTSGPAGLSGWARYPANPESSVKIKIIPQDDTQKPIFLFTENTKFFSPDMIAGDAIKHAFFIDYEKIRRKGTLFSVCSEGGASFYGSPLSLDPLAENARRYAQDMSRLFPAVCFEKHPENPESSHSFKSRKSKRLSPVSVIIPVYNGFAATKTCITLCLKHMPENARLIIVNDASPNTDIRKYLSHIASKPNILVLHNQKNLGFPKSVNHGLRHRHQNEDVVLLNSDTLVCRNWLLVLQRAAYTQPDIGTVTPLSNNATIFSYPSATQINAVPDARACQDISATMGQLWRGETIDVPTAHGFCMYIKSGCLNETGLLRDDVFAQGYGEENDFCRRAAALGWRHVACPGTFVGHAESQSFSPVKSDLIARNLRLLNALHPGYDEMVARWQDQDPLAASRKALDLARLHRKNPVLKSVILIMHDREGGIFRHVWKRVSSYEVKGIFAFVMSPEKSRSGRPVWKLSSVRDKDYPNLVIPQNAFSFRDLYKKLGCEKFEIHSYIGSTLEQIFSLSALKLPYDVYIHDYSWFCPRITLVSGLNQYCGEPDTRGCQACIRTFGTQTGDKTPLEALRRGSKVLLEKAECVICPSLDTAKRITRHFGIQPDIHAWENVRHARTLFFPYKAHHENRTIGILGAISLEKGYECLLALARLIKHARIPATLVLIGYTCDDAPLLETGVVTITGRYKEYEISALTEKYAIDWFFLPSLWPETWSYVLTHIWTSNRAAIVYDIGAPAERIKQSGGGLVIPLHTPLHALIAVLMAPYNYTGAFGTQGDALSLPPAPQTQTRPAPVS